MVLVVRYVGRDQPLKPLGVIPMGRGRIAWPPLAPSRIGRLDFLLLAIPIHRDGQVRIEPSVILSDL